MQRGTCMPRPKPSGTEARRYGSALFGDYDVAHVAVGLVPTES